MVGSVAEFYSHETEKETVMGEGLKIVYDDVAPYAKENSTPQIVKAGLRPHKGLFPRAGLVPAATTVEREFLDLRRDDLTYPGYALCYPGFSLLDGNYINMPAPAVDYGYISDEWSDADGNFGWRYSRKGLTPQKGLYPRTFLYPAPGGSTWMDMPALTISFNGKFSSVGILLTFNLLSGDYARKLNIKWYADDTLLSNKDFEPDSARYFCSNYVLRYNKIVLTFQSTSKPYRPVFLTRIDYGIYRDFLSDELLETDCLQEINAISESISINTLSFTVRAKNNIPFDLQKKQRLGLYFDGRLLGNFYLKSGARKNRIDYYMDTHDALGILDGNEYHGGICSAVKVDTVLQEIFAGEDFGYTLDESYKDVTLTGYIPYTSKRNALVQVAFAIGAIVDTSYGDCVRIYPQPQEVTGIFDNSNTFDGLTLEHSDIVTGIRLTVHSYAETDEEEELYKEALNGTQFGIRSGDREEWRWGKEHVTTHPFIVDMEVLQETLRKLEGKPVYFTLDLDVLDPSVFPGTGTPEPGGISFEELRRAVTQICSAAWIVGCDVNELSPALDASGASTAVACKIVREMLLALLGNPKIK